MSDINDRRDYSVAYLLSLLTETDKRKERLIQRGWDRVIEHGHFADASPAQLEQLRRAYFGGARHSYLVIIGNLNAKQARGETGYELFSAVEDEINAETARPHGHVFTH